MDLKRVFSAFVLIGAFTTVFCQNETTSCGGLVVGEQGTIDYLVGEAYTSFERCIWTVRTPYRSSIRITVNSLSTERNQDALTFNTVDESGLSEEVMLTGYISTPTSFVLNGTVAIVSFYSDATTQVGGGMSIRFEAEGPFDNSSVAYFEDFNTVVEYTDPAGSLRYPESGQYKNGELSTFVVTRPTWLAPSFVVADLESLNLESPTGSECKDKLHIYLALGGLYPQRELIRHTPFGGICALNQLIALPEYDLAAVVVILSTDEEGTADGFELSWTLQN